MSLRISSIFPPDCFFPRGYIIYICSPVIFHWQDKFLITLLLSQRDINLRFTIAPAVRVILYIGRSLDASRSKLLLIEVRITKQDRMEQGYWRSDKKCRRLDFAPIDEQN